MKLVVPAAVRRVAIGSLAACLTATLVVPIACSTTASYLAPTARSELSRDPLSGAALDTCQCRRFLEQPDPRVRLERPRVRGALDRTIIQRIVRSHLGRLRACYARALDRCAEPAVGKRITLQFTIMRGGRVVLARPIERGVPGHGETARCMGAELRKLRFPSCGCGGIVIVDQPIVLGRD